MTTNTTITQRLVSAAIDYLTDSHCAPATPTMLYHGLVGNRPCEISAVSFAQWLGRAVKTTATLGSQRLQYKTVSGNMRAVPVYYRRNSVTAQRQLHTLIRDIKETGAEPAAPRLRPLIIEAAAAPTAKAQPAGEFAVAGPRRPGFCAVVYTPPTSLPAARQGADDHKQWSSHGLRC